MDRSNGNGRFLTGSSGGGRGGGGGGGGRRGFRVTNALDFLYDKEDQRAPRAGSDTCERQNRENEKNERRSNCVINNVIRWINGQGRRIQQYSASRSDTDSDDESIWSRSSSTSSDYNYYVQERERRAFGAGRTEYARALFAPRLQNFGRRVENFNTQNRYPSGARFNGRFQGQAEAAPSGINGPNNGFYNASFEGAHGAGHSGMHDGRQGGGSSGIGGVGGCVGMNGVHNNRPVQVDPELINYVREVADAYNTNNGAVLGSLLCLREGHILQIRNIQINTPVLLIDEICVNPNLTVAIVSHIECVKALLTRNLPWALQKQHSCVSAIRNLLIEPFTRGELWTYPVLFTVNYDLGIVSDKASNVGRNSRTVVRITWAFSRCACFFHPDGCQCHRNPKVQLYKTRRFFRR